jgi:hypothetical protein
MWTHGASHWFEASSSGSGLVFLTYLRERLEAFNGLSFTTLSDPVFTWVARLQEPFFHLASGSGQDWQKTPCGKVIVLPQPWQDSTMG